MDIVFYFVPQNGLSEILLIYITLERASSSLQEEERGVKSLIYIKLSGMRTDGNVFGNAMIINYF
jgi:hypothetical protein